MEKKAVQSFTFERGIFAATLGALLPLIFPPLGSAPLMALRAMGGRKTFFLIGGILGVLLGFVSTFNLAGIWIPFATLFLLVTLFTEFEEMGFDLLKAGSLSVGATVGALAICLCGWLAYQGLDIGLWAQGLAAETALQMKQVSPTFQMEASRLLQMAPSGIILLLMVSLWVGLLFEARFRVWLGQKVVVRPSLCNFRVPDQTIFLALFAIGAAFVSHEIVALEVLGINLFNILVLFYFFQGLAVIGAYFAMSRMSPIWQGVLYFILIMHMFMFVSFLGLADYWLDIRTRFTKKKSATSLQ